MTKQEVLAWLRRDRVVPVVRAPDPDTALRMIEALLEGGISIVEVTMTVPNAIELIQTISERFGTDVLLGAGTVIDAHTALQCIKAGAQFVVSPALLLEVVFAANKADTVVAAGALTPTEVLNAWRMGSDVVKVFPCDAMGGAAYLKSLKAPFPEIELMPTGGVTLENLPTFLQSGAVAVGVGSNLVDPKLSREELVRRVKAFAEQAKSFTS